MVQTCLSEARTLGLDEIFLLTLRPEFFQHFGFRVVSREDLLPIVWADCVNCVKFPDCDKSPCSWEWGLSLGNYCRASGRYLALISFLAFFAPLRDIIIYARAPRRQDKNLRDL